MYNKRAMKTQLNLSIDLKTKEAFESLCQKNNVSMAQGFRHLVEEAKQRGTIVCQINESESDGLANRVAQVEKFVEQIKALGDN